MLLGGASPPPANSGGRRDASTSPCLPCTHVILCPTPTPRRVLFSEEEIRAACNRLAAQLSADYRDMQPLVLSTLTGSFMFFAELCKSLDPALDPTVDFVRASSYAGTRSKGEVQVDLSVVRTRIRRRHVIVVEDIVDTGRTAEALVRALHRQGAASVEVVALLDKAERRVVDFEPKYVGFECPDEFVVGYGLDLDERFRTLPYVGVLTEAAIAAAEKERWVRSLPGYALAEAVRYAAEDAAQASVELAGKTSELARDAVVRSAELAQEAQESATQGARQATVYTLGAGVAIGRLLKRSVGDKPVPREEPAAGEPASAASTVERPPSPSFPAARPASPEELSVPEELAVPVDFALAEEPAAFALEPVTAEESGDEAGVAPTADAEDGAGRPEDADAEAWGSLAYTAGAGEDAGAGGQDEPAPVPAEEAVAPDFWGGAPDAAHAEGAVDIATDFWAPAESAEATGADAEDGAGRPEDADAEAWGSLAYTAGAGEDAGAGGQDEAAPVLAEEAVAPDFWGGAPDAAPAEGSIGFAPDFFGGQDETYAVTDEDPGAGASEDASADSAPDFFGGQDETYAFTDEDEEAAALAAELAALDDELAMLTGSSASATEGSAVAPVGWGPEDESAREWFQGDGATGEPLADAPDFFAAPTEEPAAPAEK